MTKTSKTIVFFGNERLATGVSTTAPTLQALIDHGYNIAAVVTNYQQSSSRGARSLEIEAITQKHNIPLLIPGKLADIKDQLQAYGAPIAVLVAYGKMVPESIINLFPEGIVNIHPSLLPLHRGPIPLESVILNGDPKTGVSLMQLAKAMDAGPIYAQTEVPLGGQETKQELADHLLDIGSAMLIDLLPQILAGSVVALPQDNTRATYDNLIAKTDGTIDWTKPATNLERQIRAYASWPKSSTTLANSLVEIIQAHVVDNSGEPGRALSKQSELVIACGQQALAIDILKPAGKNQMTSAEFLRGYGQKL